MRRRFRKTRYPFSARQRQMVQRLSGCSFLPGSFEKRFVESVAEYPVRRGLTKRQGEVLDDIFKRYRGQIPDYEKIFYRIPWTPLAIQLEFDFLVHKN